MLGEAQNFVPSLLEEIFQVMKHALFEALDALHKRLFLLDQNLRRNRGRRCPDIRHKVGDGEIDLVTHRRNDGNGAAKDRPGNFFFVEGPQILDRPASPADDENIETREASQMVDSLHDLLGCAFALNPDGVDEDMKPGKPSLQRPENIDDRGSPGRGDHPDFFRQKGELFLVGGVEKAFLFQLLFELFKGQLEGTFAFWLQDLGQKLVFASGLIDIDPAPDDNLQAVF